MSASINVRLNQIDLDTVLSLLIANGQDSQIHSVKVREPHANAIESIEPASIRYEHSKCGLTQFDSVSLRKRRAT